MNDRQRLTKLLEAERSLKRTQRGYNPQGVHWRTAMRLIDEVQADLAAPVMPPLGPIVQGGKSVLLHDCTHITSGLGWPAFDDGFEQGIAVIAPENLVVIANPKTGAKWSSSSPGLAFYARGTSGLVYWQGHLDRRHAPGTKFRRGALMARTAENHVGGGPHVHLAIDARPVIGHHLKSHTNYTHGAPKIGVQLAEGMT